MSPIPRETQNKLPPSQRHQRAILEVVLNAFVPLFLYRLTEYYGGSELHALLLATSFPLAYSAVDLARSHEINPVSAIVLLGILGSSIPLFFGGSPRLLLLRESLFTGMFGFSCFVSLLLRRPLMFYFGRHFRAGSDPQKRARFDATWELPRIRFAHRLITVVWGAVLLGEFGLKVMLINYASTAWVLSVSPVVLGGLTIATVIWTFHYAKTLRGFIPPPSGPAVTAHSPDS